jgi:hypothetical protein
MGKKKIPEIETICLTDSIPPALSLCKPWEILFRFRVNSNITPMMVRAAGVFNECGGCIQSVASAFLAPDRTPTKEQLNESTVILPVAGRTGSITGELYLFGDSGFDYTATLYPTLICSGRKATMLVNFIDTNLNADTASQLILVARFFYCVC